MHELTIKLKAEHQEIYKDLENFMLALTKVKNNPDHEHLEKTCAELLSYVKDLLDNHFKEEETSLFPEMMKDSPEIVERLISDHKEIEEKFSKTTLAYEDFKKRIQDQYFTDYDYKKEILFLTYNLIATINHHAIREDAVILNP